MISTRREFVKQTAAASALLAHSGAFAQDERYMGLRSQLKAAADDLQFPGLVAGVVKEGRLVFVQTEGFADIEAKAPMQAASIFNVASLTKTFSAVMLMQYQKEKRINVEDYILDYPFLSVGFSSDRLLNANTKLKHVLSHTSEGMPGDNFVYSGSRYNFLYGVFEKISGNTQHYRAVAQEVSQRILTPLGMSSTLPGYPADKNDPNAGKLVTSYLVDKSHQGPVRDNAMPGNSGTLFPATNLFTSVEDLALYTTALDENVLLPLEYYNLMTTPFTLNNGSKSPYGFGWSVQKVGSLTAHWHYGWGDSYSALIVRIPEKKITFILLANSSGASAPFMLQYGNLLTSPFAVSFIATLLPGPGKATMPHELPPFLSADTTIPGELFFDSIFANALVRQYMEANFGLFPGQTKALLKYMCLHDAQRFQKLDLPLIGAVAATGEAVFTDQMSSLARAYRASGLFHPDITLAIADYYEQIGNVGLSSAWLSDSVQRFGYGEEASTRQACVELGMDLLKQGKADEGRVYLWKAAQYGRVTETSGYQEDLITKMRSFKTA
jgi:CubicO group peptidase (beta-lactamase class C family)